MTTQKIDVLIAEDDPAELQLLRIAMKLAGLTPLLNKTLAYNGLEAIEAMEETTGKMPFDLLLLDLNMPKVRGKQVLEYLKQSQIKLPLVIILSNSDSKKDIEDCFRLGADGYLVKPADFDDLISFCKAIKVCLEKYGAVSVESIHAHYESLKINPQLPKPYGVTA